jgi:hypothetical protein
MKTSITEIKNLLDKEDWSKEDISTLLNSQKRQVKWLFNNSNKMTIVYDEKFVRLLMHKSQQPNRAKDTDEAMGIVEKLETEINNYDLFINDNAIPPIIAQLKSILTKIKERND